jgi:hypothetical protein
MHLTTRQAAERLGINATKVQSLIKKGILTDVGVTTPGATKHVFLIDSRDVEAYRRGARGAINGQTAPTPPPQASCRRLRRQRLNRRPPRCAASRTSSISSSRFGDEISC